jgi:hypothetical protein
MLEISNFTSSYIKNFWKDSKVFFISNGRYIDYLSLTHVTDRDKILKVTLKTFKISIGLLIIRRNHKSKREKVSFPSFLFWPPSIAYTLSS